MAAPGILGTGTYAIRFVRRRTAATAASVIGGELAPASGSWGRSINLTSEASVIFNTSGSSDCIDVLAQLEGWRHEMEIYRDPGGLVWAGPVGDVIANPDTPAVTVTAKDLSAWWAKRGLFQKIVNRQQDLADIFAEYLAIGFDVDDPGIDVVASAIGVLGDRTIAAGDLKMLDSALAELTTSGVDWTTAARTFFVGGVEIAQASRLPGRLMDEHFITAPQTRRSGAGMVNDARVRANKFTGAYGGPDSLDGVLLQGVEDQQSIGDQASADAAAQSWWDRVHDPLVYLDGDNTLAPDAPIDIQQMIAGLLVMVDVLGGGVVPVRQMLRLERLAATFDQDGERLTVTLQPPGQVAT